MSTYKHNCTKGPATWKTGRGNTRNVTVLGFPSTVRINARPEGGSLDEVDANAALIAEAFNVLAETGMTPRELADFVRMVARLETASEVEERTDDAMSGDDAMDTLSLLIDGARKLTAAP